MARDRYLDYLKGILILLITFAHGMQYLTYNNPDTEVYAKFWDNRLFEFICIFNMPLFIAVSGYFTFFSLKKYSFKEYLLNRFLYIFIPMVSWSLIHAVIQVLLGGQVTHLFAYAFTDICRVFWFIWAIILHSMFICVLNKMKIDNIYILLGTVVISSLLPSSRLPYILPIINTMYPFFVFGYIVASKRLHEQIMQNRKIIAGIIVIAVVLYFFWKNDTNYYVTPSGIENLAVTIYRLFAASSIVASVTILFYYIYKKTEKLFVSGFLVQAGKNSLVVYLSQMVLINLFTTYFYNRIYISESLLCIIPTLLFILIINLLVMLLVKNKYTSLVLLGKKT